MLTTQAAAELKALAPKVYAHLQRVEQLTTRGHEVAGEIESGIDYSACKLTEYAQFGAEMGRHLQVQADAAAQQIEALVNRGYDYSHRLESQVRACALRLDQLADRSLEISAKAEKCLLELNDTSLRAQEMYDRFQAPAGELLARLTTTFALLEAAGRNIKATASVLHRPFSMVAWAVTFPVRCIRHARQVKRVTGSENSLRHVDLNRRRESESRIPLAAILPGVIIEQTFVPKLNGLIGIGLTFCKLQQDTRSTVQVAIVDGEGKVIRQETLDAASLPDNQPFQVDFERLHDSANIIYRVRLSSSDSRPGDAVTVWSRLTALPKGLTFCGKIVEDAELIFELGYGHAAVGSRQRAVGSTQTAETASCPPSTAYCSSSQAERDLLIVCPDHLGATRIGLAMRHWEIALALGQAGLRVTLASTQPLPAEMPTAPFPIADFSRYDATLTEKARRHAAIMVQGGALKKCPWLREVGRPMIADMITPFHIENIQTGRGDFQRLLAMVTDSLDSADFFICGNERQRLYWLGMLTALGRLSKSQCQRNAEFRKLIDVVGFGIPSEEPQSHKPALKGVVPGIRPGDFVLTWFGGIWDWLDPLPLVRGVVAAHQTNPRIKLYFSMYRRDNEQPTLSAQRVRNLAIQLGALHDSVFFSELPAPFDRRADYLLDSDMGVILQSPNFETQISARTRAMDYLWANLPILINRGDEIAEMVESHKLGLVLGSSDSDEIARELLAYVHDAEGIAKARQSIQAQKCRFQWSRMVQPIAEFCRDLANTP